METKNMGVPIAEAFTDHKAFIPFVTCGDPDLDTTEKLIVALAEAGADLIELGIPFSDPTAEGPVIQAANVRALRNQVTTDDVFAMVERVRPLVSVPLLFMTYANVVYGYGIERFCARAAEVGITGLILPDVPYEEKAEFDGACVAHGIELVSMIAPTSESRVGMIAREAKGFIYCVSSLGVTGVRNSFTGDIDGMVDAVRKASEVPCAIGFGISTPEAAARMASKADGVIVGSAIVKLIGQHGVEAVEPVVSFARSIVEAIR